MTSTDVSGTRDTTGVTGLSAGTSTADRASNRDTTTTGGGGVDDPSNSPATQPDTSGVQGGENQHHDHDPQQYVEGTIDTTQPGGPRRDADPAYRPPSDPPPATTKDTTRTDIEASNGLDRPNYEQNMTQQYDTVNPHVPLRTTSDAIAGAPAAPVATAGPRGVTVALTPVADPAGAPVTGYRIEGSTGGVTFAGRNQTTKFVENLTTSQGYKFRVAAVTDNGVGPFSPWSNVVKPFNPDQAGPGHATTVTEANRVNPIYGPDGSVKPGTGGTTGPVQGLTAAATATPGEVDVDWTAPAWGDPDGYVVVASSGETVTVGDVLTVTLTGLDSGTPVTVKVTPTNERGNGIANISATVTPA